ncbi:MAG TPA: hypothetical protein VGL28_12680 [Steroidobacteraceae bacterium]|jgi:hypothetical protein
MTATVDRARLAVRCAPAERALWQEVTARLNEGLSDARTFQAVWRDDLSPPADDGCDVLCLSMFPELSRPRGDWQAIEAQWRVAVAGLRDREIERGASVYIVTLFRYTTAGDHALLPMLRRLNLLAVHLSQEFGLFVIDIDRIFAHAGGRQLSADVRLASAAARRSAADAIVERLLSTGIDQVVEPAAIQAARNWLESRRVVGPASTATAAAAGLIERRYVRGRAQTSLTQSHDVYGGIRSLFRDLCAPRRGLKWRMPLLIALWRMVSDRVISRIGWQRT